MMSSIAEKVLGTRWILQLVQLYPVQQGKLCLCVINFVQEICFPHASPSLPKNEKAMEIFFGIGRIWWARQMPVTE